MRPDLWFALRRIRLRPLHSTVIALTLGIGIGAALAVFAVVDAVLVRPLPYADAGRLVRITRTLPVPRLPGVPYSDIGFRRLASDSRTLVAAAAIVTRDVDWIEGADYYAKLHVGAKVHMLRETLTSLEQRLDPRRFLRIHKSAIVNLTRVRAVESHVRGEGIAVLAGGARLKVTRARREELERRLEDLHDAHWG